MLESFYALESLKKGSYQKFIKKCMFASNNSDSLHINQSNIINK